MTNIPDNLFSYRMEKAYVETLEKFKLCVREKFKEIESITEITFTKVNLHSAKFYIGKYKFEAIEKCGSIEIYIDLGLLRRKRLVTNPSEVYDAYHN